jgi:hypothetical protein
MDVDKWFLKNARVTRAAAARFAQVPREDLDAEADDLDFGSRLSLRQFVDLLNALEDEDEDEDEDGDPDDEDDDTDETEAVEG